MRDRRSSPKLQPPCSRIPPILTLGSLFVVLAGCVGTASPSRQAPAPGTGGQPGPAEATPTDIWQSLFEQTPQAVTTPLPEPVPSPLDGTYAKVDPDRPQWWACRRCADYRPAGGVWKLSFDRGIMRVFYEIPAWRTIASFNVSGDRIFLFNDAICPAAVGEYAWELIDKNLMLEVIRDPCSFGLRGENLSRQPWPSCAPPEDLDAASDQWLEPAGCQPDQHPEPYLLDGAESMQVTVHPGIATDLEHPPDLIADANPGNAPPPEGVRVRSSPDSIPYGRNLVLWREGDRVRVRAEVQVSAMGVQFHGDHTIGWARVFFDGIEVWRGDTSQIWTHLGRHGGYIEVTGFKPGAHTLTVECLAVDRRPITVAFFGFTSDRPAGHGD